MLLLRHGETEWSRTGRHTGTTDVPLTERGEEQARAAAPVVASYEPSLVVASPLERARRTADLAGLRVDRTDDDLREWDYGEVEGITTKDWQRRDPGWSVWERGAPGGESADEVGARADRVLARVTEGLEGEHPTVALVAHGHLLRVLAARWLGLDAAAGALLRLDPATLSLLGYEHDRRVVLVWNAPVST
ncbi:histidine phosphatase family protein [Vallicoccus soli]|uniref:Histidine phosphatase family protein n=1 Tax=Vallicoccus soli TaxID=2339232 RepID=A0A3A3Z4L3_9ACTN|nr:histidine phosphatase family protein [Vallicoccus soli]